MKETFKVLVEQDGEYLVIQDEQNAYRLDDKMYSLLSQAFAGVEKTRAVYLTVEIQAEQPAQQPPAWDGPSLVG